MLYVINHMVTEEAKVDTLKRVKLSDGAVKVYNELCALDSRTLINDLTVYPRKYIDELSRNKLVMLTQALDSYQYVLLVGSWRLPVAICSYRTVKGIGGLVGKPKVISQRVF